MAVTLFSLDPSDDDYEMVEINTTPLIDVMLVLLVMLIITIPMQTQSVDLHLPTQSAPPPPQPPPAVEIQLDAQGGIKWNDKLIDGKTLAGLMHTVGQQADQPEMHLKADKLTAYKYLAALLAEAQRSGVKKIGIVQER